MRYVVVYQSLIHLSPIFHLEQNAMVFTAVSDEDDPTNLHHRLNDGLTLLLKCFGFFLKTWVGKYCRPMCYPAGETGAKLSSGLLACPAVPDTHI